uniref:Uncharacterized protein n=1 Tax=Lepeophtheirus salmonis TaxID=72036 RepID=A0A0K2ULM8_LEPSM
MSHLFIYFSCIIGIGIMIRICRQYNECHEAFLHKRVFYIPGGATTTSRMGTGMCIIREREKKKELCSIG